ncbi:MAG TPA: hypothetical protein VKB79_26050 [Bryobacteraceae bacterium]|nr:hypothetical protein [Bryobacteraceae bacterium]
MRNLSVWLGIFAALLCAGWGAGGAYAKSDSDIETVVGTWRGRSICQTDAPACHNEDVIYLIREMAGRTDAVFIQADKIVDGKRITMGSGPWQFDRTQHTLEFRMPRQVWLLKVSGSHIDGTLKLADQTIFRRMTLERDR